MQLFGHKARFTTLLILMSLLTCLLFVKTGIAASGKGGNEVRMAVDPTVLPPVQPPSDDDLPPEPMAEQPAAPEVELPDIEKRTPMPKPPAKAAEKQTPSATEVVETQATTPPAPKAEPKKEPAPAPKAEAPPKPAPETKPAPAPKAEAKPKPKPEPTVTPTPPGVGKGTVTKITMDSTSKEFTLTVYCNRPVGDTTYMNLSNPRRLVVDLREPWFLKAKNVVRVNSGAVKHVVVGTHPDRLRMVIHFRTPPKGGITPSFVRTGNKLIVTGRLP